MKKYIKYIMCILAAAVLIGIMWFSEWKEREKIRKSWFSSDGYHYYELPSGGTDADPIIKHKGE